MDRRDKDGRHQQHAGQAGARTSGSSVQSGWYLYVNKHGHETLVHVEGGVPTTYSLTEDGRQMSTDAQTALRWASEGTRCNDGPRRLFNAQRRAV